MAEGSASHFTFGDLQEPQVNLHPESTAFKCGNSVLKHAGTWYLRVLFVRSRILIWFLDFAVSHCREVYKRKIYSLIWALVSTAAFWISWRVFRDLLWQPNIRGFQSFSLEVTKAWNNNNNNNNWFLHCFVGSRQSLIFLLYGPNPEQS